MNARARPPVFWHDALGLGISLLLIRRLRKAWKRKQVDCTQIGAQRDRKKSEMTVIVSRWFRTIPETYLSAYANQTL